MKRPTPILNISRSGAASWSASRANFARYLSKENTIMQSVGRRSCSPRTNYYGVKAWLLYHRMEKTGLEQSKIEQQVRV